MPEVSEGGWDPRQPLNWIIPQLPRVEARVEVLADSSRHDEHEAAARDILATLHNGATSLLWLRPHMPRIVAVEDHGPSKSMLMELGSFLDTALKTEGLVWPPPRKRPPPSVTLDLLEMYKYGSREKVTLGEDPWDRLIPILLTVASKSKLLLSHLSATDVEKVRRIAEPRGDRRSRVGMFLSGSALIISLIQGPGAVNEFPGEVVEFGADMRPVVSSIVHGISRLLNVAVDEMRN